MNIQEFVIQIMKEGYNEANAQAKACQDILLNLISKSTLNRNVTIKGGVVLRSISGNARRATQDMDIDFIRYSLDEEAIRVFIRKLDSISDCSLKIIGNIEELKQQDYHGKRVRIEIIDEHGAKLTSKIDMGVHTKLKIDQEEYCFDVGFDDEGASLLINSKEQMLTEKLRSILKFGTFSTRYKDIYDIYYLLEFVNYELLADCFKQYIFDDPGMRENTLDDVIKRVHTTFNDKGYRKKLETSKRNWVDVPNDEVIVKIESCIIEMEK